MSEISERYRKVAGAFTERVEAVPDEAWDNPAPCEGWVARDVVGHMVEWLPGLCLESADIEAPTMPSVDEDPVGAWAASAAHSRRRSTTQRSPCATLTWGPVLDRRERSPLLHGDVLVHTWDLES